MGDTTSPLLRIEHLTIGLRSSEGYLKAVDDISFSVNHGETFALLGESSCGKTLTALAINRLLPPNACYGQRSAVYHKGTDLLTLSEEAMRPLRGKKIGMVFQEPMTSLNPVLTVGEQITEALLLDHASRNSSCKQRVLDTLAVVGIPDPLQCYSQYPHQLSGGMKQRVVIAMAIAGEPDLLIADEPTTALDVTIQGQILELFKALQRKTGMAILLISHDLGVVSALADRVAVMYAGKIIERGSVSTYFDWPAHPYSEQLFAVIPSLAHHQEKLQVVSGHVPSLKERTSLCQFIARCPHALAVCRERPPVWNELGNFHGVWCHRFNEGAIEKRPKVDDSNSAFIPLPTPSTEPPVLSVHQLEVHIPIEKGLFKRKAGVLKVVDGIDFSLYAGKTLALVGESGCGKSTLGKAILHLLSPTQGEITYQGERLSILSPQDWHRLRQELQIVFQDPYSSLNPHWLVEDILVEGLVAQDKISSPAQQAAKVKELLEAVGLPPDSGSRYPHEFSGGQRQRIGIARALAVNPKVIVCDEPTSALDLTLQAQVLNLLHELQETHGLAYLFITHNMSVVAYLADEVAVMYLGRIVEQGPVEKLLVSPKHPYTQMLMAAVLETRGQLPLKEEIGVPEEAASFAHPPSGCHFHPRCPHVMDQCRQRYPETTEVEAGWQVKCFLYNQ